MNTSKHCTPPAPPAGATRRAPARVFVLFGLLTLFICSAFTVAATLTVWALYNAAATPMEPGFALKLGLRVALFGLAAGLSLGVAWRICASDPSARLKPAPASGRHRDAARGRIALIGAVCAAAALALPRLDYYPHAMPDETHHLIVARNLAGYGVYGSGHPDQGFEVFDDYDSVGPPVIGPVAAAFRLFGTRLATARGVMALAFFLPLAAAAYFLAEPVFTPLPSALGALFLATTWGSVYLGRTLYGEVPALLFVFLALLCWRRAISGSKGMWLWSVCAGLLFGCAFLSKNLILLILWPFLGAWLHDRLTRRVIPVGAVVFPAAGFCAVAGAWMLVQASAHSAASDATHAQMAMYWHYLLFGLGSLPRTMQWFAERPFLTVTAATGSLFAVHRIVRLRYDPALLVLAYAVPFFVYWWTCFTTGSLPRYLWYALALAGLFSGFAVWQVAQKALKPRQQIIRRSALIAATAGLLAAPGWLIGQQLERVYVSDEMHDDRALAAFVETLPENCLLATTFYPAKRWLNFALLRQVKLVRWGRFDPRDYDAIILGPGDERPEDTQAEKTIGRYDILLQPGAHK